MGTARGEQRACGGSDQYDSPKFFGSMEETDIETFKAKVFMKKNHGKKLVIRR
jgi:hypothetical protein